MLRQLASEETLVPPNFRTTHCGKLRATMLPRYGLYFWNVYGDVYGAGQGVRGRSRLHALSLIIEDVAQILLELAICEHLFELAPRGFAALALSAYAFVHAVQNTVVISTVFGCVIEEFVV